MIQPPDFETCVPSLEAIRAEKEAARPRLRWVRAADVQLRRVAYLWEGRIPLGALTLMPGEEGIGKTTVGIRLMSDLTTGKLDGEFLGEPKSVLVISPEDGVSDVMTPRFGAAEADRERVFYAMGIDDPAEQVFTDGIILPNDLDLLTDIVREQDVRMLWIDSLVTTLPPEIKSISYKDVTRVLRPIGAFAEREHVAVVAPWHLNKGGGSESAVRMMDSRAFRSATRSVLMVVPAESPDGATEGIVALDKANAGPLQIPALRYRLRSAGYTVEENGRQIESTCGVADWLGPEEGDGRELVRAALAPQRQSSNEAVSWLSDYLAANGPTERTVLLRDGRDEMGYNERRLDRAAKSLGVLKTEKTGRNETTGTPWRKTVWSMPGQQIPG